MFPEIFKISSVFVLSSQIFLYFLIFFSAILVNSLVKLGALPMRYFMMLLLEEVPLSHHQILHVCRCSA